MELDELKNIWKEENKNLDNKIKLNESLLIKMNMKNTSGEFNQMLSQALLGRNLALVYCLLSLIMAVLLMQEIVYSLPAILGGLAMLWSFTSHLSIEKPNYTASLVQLQKTICHFRIHMATNAKYDMVITAFWMLTIVPICLKYFFSLSVYSDLKALSGFCLILGVVVILMIALSRKTYQKYDQKLKDSEAYLAELIDFEKR